MNNKNPMKNRQYWIYILECENGNYYTGYTDDLVKRYQAHVSGKGGAKYTKAFKPVRIAQCWKLKDTKGTALKVEHFIKSRNRMSKDKIIERPEMLKILFQKKYEMKITLTPQDPEKFEKKVTGSISSQ